MERGFRDVFVDLLDTAGQLAVQDRFSERASERSEGSAEFANPATVTQPVHPSQFPGGHPVHNTVRNTTGPSPVMLVAGGIALLITGIVVARLLR